MSTDVVTEAGHLIPASSSEDASAYRDMTTHHAALLATLSERSDALIRALLEPAADATASRQALIEFLNEELLPHAAAEESSLYQVAAKDPRLTLLVEAMIAEHHVIGELADAVRTASGNQTVVVAAATLPNFLQSHVAKENDQLLRAVAADPDTSLAAILADMHEELAPEQSSGCGGQCTCGHVDADEAPVLDARLIPHAVRHATILGAWSSIGDGASLVLVAPHDPLPLLSQLRDTTPTGLDVNYIVSGPDEWRLLLTRGR